jgi:hypothetical protein
VGEVLADHVTFEVECIDRMYLNVYVPQLQYATGLVSYIRRHLGRPVASTVVLAPVSEAFIRAVRAFAADRQIPWVDFARGQRKDDVAHEYLAAFEAAGRTEGVLFIGRAQDKVPLFRTGLRLTDPRAQALLHILLIFRLHPSGFLNRNLRELLAESLCRPPGTITPGQATYDLRRLREHGLIERIPRTHRYQVTDTGLRHAMFLTRVHDRVLLTGIAQLNSPAPAALRQADRAYHAAICDPTRSAGLAA